MKLLWVMNVPFVSSAYSPSIMEWCTSQGNLRFLGGVLKKSIELIFNICYIFYFAIENFKTYHWKNGKKMGSLGTWATILLTVVYHAFVWGVFWHLTKDFPSLVLLFYFLREFGFFRLLSWDSSLNKVVSFWNFSFLSGTGNYYFIFYILIIEINILK